jgi:hypothetical protein
MVEGGWTYAEEALWLLIGSGKSVYRVDAGAVWYEKDISVVVTLAFVDLRVFFSQSILMIGNVKYKIFLSILGFTFFVLGISDSTNIPDSL